MSQPHSTSRTLIENNDDPQARETLIEQLVTKPKLQPMKMTRNASSTTPGDSWTPSNLLELKQQRLLAAADRKNRLITRIITIVGLLIILLCAIIVTLTLKMAPKIDELVRTKAGGHSSVHLMSRMTTSPLSMIELNNSTTSNSSIFKPTFRTQQR